MLNNWKKNIILFLTSQSVSLFGSMLVQYAIMWHITLKTQSGVMMTISIVCGFLPTFFLSPFAGVWADRYNRKTLIILSDSLIAISTLILAILFLNGYNSIWMLFVTLAVRAFGPAIQTPAIGAFLPQFVPEDKLTKVNATNSSIQSLVMLVCPMLSGALLTMASWGGFKNRVHTMVFSTICIGVGTFALGIISVFWIYLIFMVLIGVVMPMFNTPATVLLQEKVEPDFMGRIFGVLGMISSIMMPLGMLVFGPIADFVEIEYLLIGTGLLLFVQGFFMLETRY